MTKYIGNVPSAVPLTSADITDGIISTAKIAADAIDGTKIADDAINSEHYTDGSIDTAHIGDSQVTAAKATGIGGMTLISTHTESSGSAGTIDMNGVFMSTIDTE